MTAKPTAPAETFVKFTRGLLEHPGWQPLGINARRFVDFLMLELLRHGGNDNGRLKATHRQLVEYGIHGEYVANAIREAEQAGIVTCSRGGMRVATLYGLAWLPADQKPQRKQKSATQRRGKAATQ